MTRTRLGVAMTVQLRTKWLTFRKMWYHILENKSVLSELKEIVICQRSWYESTDCHNSWFEHWNDSWVHGCEHDNSWVHVKTPTPHRPPLYSYTSSFFCHSNVTLFRSRLLVFAFRLRSLCFVSGRDIIAFCWCSHRVACCNGSTGKKHSWYVHATFPTLRTSTSPWFCG